MRLIDADELEKIIEMSYCLISNGEIVVMKPDGHYEPLLSQIPTAYDVEAVENELEQLVAEYQTLSDDNMDYEDYFTIFSAKKISFEHALDIVRNGRKSN